MAGGVDTLSTLNSLVRTFVAVALLAAVGGGGWWGYQTIEAGKREAQQKAAELREAQARLQEQERLLAARQRELAAQAARIGQLQEDVRQGQQRIDRLETTVRLLTVDQRVARLTVLDQNADPQTGRIVTDVQFTELDPRGRPLDEPRVFSIPGDVVYVDNWIVKFEDRYLEQDDELRSTSLVLFRRIFGENQEPADGYPIDRVGVRPKAYSSGAPLSDFEQRIWNDFWRIANDPQRAASMGIRAAHGEAVSMKVRPGRSYRLMLRASDGLSIVPEPGPPS